ncbi:hypothetical protein MMC30_001401 [Trapelia coarctata]|nr:hypothetical protein [Trapelia coarctata]
MATEVYRKVGRGGAGNFYTKTEKAAALAGDLEAQKPSKPVEPAVSDRAPAENAYSGRGGAGNWYSPKEIQATGPTPSEPSSVAKPIAPAKPAFQGRGGAGNYNDDEAEKKLQEQKAAEEAKKWEQEAIEMVDMGLRPPEKAYLATERAEISE